MAFADPTPWLVPAVATAAVIGLFTLLAASILYGIRRAKRRVQKTLEQQYDGIEIHDEPEPGDVHLSYHTYYLRTQTSHHVTLPAAHARELLNRLLRFNLNSNRFSPFFPFFWLFVYLNYRAQLRSISRQEARQGTPEPFVQSPSFILRFLGWVIAALSALLGIAVIQIVVMGEFEKLPFAILVTALSAWFSRKVGRMTF